MPKARLILLRHGQAEWNVEGRYQGQLDSALTAAGRAQAEALATRLARQRAAALYSSDLGRAQETARLIAEASGLPVILESRLRERHLGMFQGLRKSEIREKFPDEYRRFKSDSDYIVPGGESARQFAARVIDCLEEIASRHGGQEIVVVTHGGPVSSLLCHTLNIPLGGPRRFERPNASWNVFLFDNGKWLLETWGDASHLASGII
jgi:probable phosphoglycerate mutase